MVLDVLKECPALENSGFSVQNLIGAVMQGAGGNLQELEAAIAAAGAITDEVAAGFMGVGAMAEIAEDLVGERAELVRAGRAVGRLMRKRYAAKIAEELEKKRGAAS